MRVDAIVKIGDAELHGKTIDVSNQGANILMFRNLPPGAACQVALRLQSGGRSDVVHVQARVIHSILTSEGGFKVGMQFTAMNSDSRSVLSIALM